MASWTNWAGDQSCTPAEIARPRSREEVGEIVALAAASGQAVHAAASGHSFTEAALTDGVMLRLEALDRILEADRESGLVKVEAGITLAKLSEQLWDLGLALENLGDIDTQTLAGAISTGTHGTGIGLRNISSQVEAIELIDGRGETVQLTRTDEPGLLLAARIGIGALGVITGVTLRCVPAFVLDRVDASRPTGEVLDTFQERAAQHDHFELFTFPYADTALVLERNRSGAEPRPRGRAAAFLNDVVLENWALGGLARSGRRFNGAIPALSRFAARVASGSHAVDRSYRIFANERRVRFTEMEYGIPREHGPEAARRVIDWVRSNRYPVFFPIEMRVVAGDDALLSPSHERDTAYIAVHQYEGMEWRPYFEAIEAIMNSYGGRPHWGKRHFQTHETLPALYPRWADFTAARDRLDPDRTFRNPYTDRVLGPT